MVWRICIRLCRNIGEKRMKDKVVVIHQPDFIPYLGFFDRLLKADIFVILDNVQYVRDSSRAWTARDKIKTEKGEKWIKVGTRRAPLGTKINEIMISEENNWRASHINLFQENYRSAPYYDEIIPYIKELYEYRCKYLVDFNLKAIRILLELFDIKIQMIVASELNVNGKNNELVINIVRKLGCKKYLSGVGARDYYVPELYEKAGIDIIWQDFKHPVYKQQFNGFIPYLSCLDLLFNCGVDGARKILRGECENAGRQNIESGGVKTFLLCAGFKRKKFIRKNSSNTSTRFYAILRIF